MHEDVMTQHITRPKEVRPAASIRALLLASWLGIASLPGSASDLQPNVPQRGYSTATLREPIFDAARVAVETTAFNNWLNANYGSLGADRMARPREHLYYLIDSHIKNQFESTGQVWPTKHDPILELLFSWAERLGVYGGNVVYDRLRSTDTASSETLNSLPKGVAIDLEGDLLHVRSDLGWSVQFPYYFMVIVFRDLAAPNGFRTQLMIVSTGAAKDRGVVGHSQATLMLLYSPDADNSTFRTFVEERLGVSKSDEHVSLGVQGLTSHRNVEKSGLIHRELVFIEPTAGALGVAYLGNDGTYQWNRQHFLDFLGQIHTASSAPANNAPNLKPKDD